MRFIKVDGARYIAVTDIASIEPYPGAGLALIRFRTIDHPNWLAPGGTHRPSYAVVPASCRDVIAALDADVLDLSYGVPRPTNQEDNP